MGLTTTNYMVKAFGITLTRAFAKISRIDFEGENVRAEFAIFGEENHAPDLLPLETLQLVFTDDGTPIFEQAYARAAEDILLGWVAAAE